MNIRDITDESGYIEAIGKRAAAEAINQAKVEVAEPERTGAIGEATANREREIQVANQSARPSRARRQAERDQRVAVAKFEAEGITGEVDASREQEVAIAASRRRRSQGQKQAEQEQRIQVAEARGRGRRGREHGQGRDRATTRRRSPSAGRRQAARRGGGGQRGRATSSRPSASRSWRGSRRSSSSSRRSSARRSRSTRRPRPSASAAIAHGEADAILAKYEAEAKGVQAVLEAKASRLPGAGRGVRHAEPHLAPTLLMVEKMPELVAEQVKAIQNLKIDKITVWDSGQNGADGTGSTAGFLRSLIGSLPPMHDLARQAGVDLPGYLGTVEDSETSKKDEKK